MSTLVGTLSGWFGQMRAQAKGREKSGATTGGSKPQKPQVVWRAANPMEAQVIQGRLASEGIPSCLRGESLGRIYGFTSGGLAVTEVLVPEPLAERAMLLLGEEDGREC